MVTRTATNILNNISQKEKKKKKIKLKLIILYWSFYEKIDFKCKILSEISGNDFTILY